MNTNKKFLFFIISLLLTFLVPNFAKAALYFPPPAAGQGKKVVICHYPPGNIANVQQISVSLEAAQRHQWDNQGGTQHEFDEYAVNGVCPSAVIQKDAAIAAVNTAVQELDTAIATNQPAPVITQKEDNLNAAIIYADTIVTAVDSATAGITKNGGGVFICHVAPGNGRVIGIEVDSNSLDKDKIAHYVGSHGGDYAMPADGSCAIPITPTVQSDRTPDTTPIVTGTTGTTRLKGGEIFTVKINGIIYMEGSTTNPLTLTNNAGGHNQNWSVQVKETLAVGTNYPVEAKRGTQIGTGNIEIICPTGQTFSGGICVISCNTPKIADSTGKLCVCPTTMWTNSATGGCATKPTCSAPTPNYNETTNQCEATPTNSNPTITSIDGHAYTTTAIESNNPKPIIKGTIGSAALVSNDTFSVKITGGSENVSHTYNKDNSALHIDGLNWTLTIPEDDNLPIGIYEIEAAKNVTYKDSSNHELKIYLDACRSKIDKKIISFNDWDKVHDNLGTCRNDDEQSLPKPCENPQLGDECEDLPPDPEAKQYETIAPNALVMCDDGGVKSSSATLSGLTIKRARIANVHTTKPITFGTTTVDPSGRNTLRYGIKTPAVGEMDISGAVITGGNKATGVTLTGVTLTNVYIDTTTDCVTHGEPCTHIDVIGGTTKGTITRGVVTGGRDENNNPVRGAITTGYYDAALNENAVTQGRRVQGTLTNATIINAQTTTVDGVTAVDQGTITAGEINDAIIFGTVVNATLSNATITNTNYCFSSGTVGNKGQLNWKEVVK